MCDGSGSGCRGALIGASQAGRDRTAALALPFGLPVSSAASRSTPGNKRTGTAAQSARAQRNQARPREARRAAAGAAGGAPSAAARCLRLASRMPLISARTTSRAGSFGAAAAAAGSATGSCSAVRAGGTRRASCRLSAGRAVLDRACELPGLRVVPQNPKSGHTGS